MNFYVEQLQYIHNYQQINTLPEYLERYLDKIIYKLFVENEIRNIPLDQHQAILQTVKNMKINIEFIL